MPFDKFVDMPKVWEERRKHIRESLRSISIEELRKLAKEHEDEFLNDPWRDKMLRLIEERPQASFYHAEPEKNVVVIYCLDEDFGLWILRGSGMGPLPEEGKRHVKEALGLAVSSEKEIPQPGQFFRDTQNPKSTKN